MLPLKPLAQQVELLPVVDELDVDLLVNEQGDAEVEYVMGDGPVHLRLDLRRVEARAFFVIVGDVSATPGS